MAIIYEKCDEDSEPMRLVRSVMEQYHGDLVEAGVTVECMLAASDTGGDAVKHHGWPCYAKVRVMPLIDRVGGSADARIVIDEEKWGNLSAEQRRALVDHEVEHLVLAKNRKTGSQKQDDAGRPVLKCRPHDWELTGFNSVVSRHGHAAMEVRNVVNFVTSEDGQMVMQFAGEGGGREVPAPKLSEETMRKITTAARDICPKDGSRITSVTLSTPGGKPVTLTSETRKRLDKQLKRKA